MSKPTDPRRALQIIVPTGASHFAVYRLTKKDGKQIQTKMRGEPDDSGFVPDTWPVAEFSVRAVLANWGEGRYRVQWYTPDAQHMKGAGETFDVSRPKSRNRSGRRLSAQTDDGGELVEPEARAAAQIAAGAPMGILELMALMRQEREEQREIAAQQRESDRQFWLQMQTQQSQLLQTVMGRGGSGADSDLLRREMALDLDKKLFELRQELATDPDEREDDREPEDREPPKNLDEAAERIGMAFLEQIEGAAPELVSKMVPKFLSMLRAQGLEPSAEMQARIAAAQNGHAHRG
jgi:hypothetical protein